MVTAWNVGRICRNRGENIKSGDPDRVYQDPGHAKFKHEGDRLLRYAPRWPTRHGADPHFRSADGRQIAGSIPSTGASQIATRTISESETLNSRRRGPARSHTVKASVKADKRGLL